MKLFKFLQHFTKMRTSPSHHYDPSLLSLVENSSFVKKPKRHYSLKIESKSPEKSINITKKPISDHQKTFELIKEMRKDKNAPVDLLGSHLQFNEDDPKDVQGFQLITSLILSVQTKDQITDMIMKRMLEKGLNLDFIDKMSLEELKNMIYETNFNNNKAKYLKTLAQTLKKDYNGKMPEKYEEILKLPGVGPKIAILYMQFQLNKNVGIAVDTHVHRISNRLNWVKTKTPEGTRKELQVMFEKDVWIEINEILVGFGQTVCLPINPKCKECLLNEICPEGIKNLKMEGSRGKKTKKK